MMGCGAAQLVVLAGVLLFQSSASVASGPRCSQRYHTSQHVDFSQDLEQLSLLQARVRRVTTEKRSPPTVNPLGIAEHNSTLGLPYDVIFVPPQANLEELVRTNMNVEFMDLSRVVHNNLGGMGPDSGPEELRYSRVITFPQHVHRGLSIDLVVIAESSYNPKNEENNGARGVLGQISMRGSEETNFNFSFYETGTYTPVIIKQLYWSFYDIDRAKPGSPVQEQLFMEHYEVAFLSTNTSIELLPRDGSHRPVFSSTFTDTDGNLNPRTPADLSTEQQNHAVLFSFLSVWSFRTTFRVSGHPNNGRNFLFSGAPSFPRCVEDFEIADLRFRRRIRRSLEYSNLGGAGPNFTKPEGIRYKKVLKNVDMLLKTSNDQRGHGYWTKRPWRNGVKGNFGRINMFGPNISKFTIKFIDRHTQEPVWLQNLMFSFLDVDGDSKWGYVEKIIVGGFDRLYLENHTRINTTLLADGRTLFYPMIAESVKNVGKSKLTAAQLANSFTIRFANVSSFSFVVDLSETGGKKRIGRNLFFAGKSRLNNAEEVGFCDEAPSE